MADLDEAGSPITSIDDPGVDQPTAAELAAWGLAGEGEEDEENQTLAAPAGEENETPAAPEGEDSEVPITREDRFRNVTREQALAEAEALRAELARLTAAQTAPPAAQQPAPAQQTADIPFTQRPELPFYEAAFSEKAEDLYGVTGTNVNDIVSRLKEIGTSQEDIQALADRSWVSGVRQYKALAPMLTAVIAPFEALQAPAIIGSEVANYLKDNPVEGVSQEELTAAVSTQGSLAEWRALTPAAKQNCIYLTSLVVADKARKGAVKPAPAAAPNPQPAPGVVSNRGGGAYQPKVTVASNERAEFATFKSLFPEYSDSEILQLVRSK